MKRILISRGWQGRVLEAGGTLCALLLLGMLIGGGTARANDIYLAQNAAGANNGSCCANAFPYSFFNAAGNWGGAANQIGPGTTVHLCSVIADSLNGTLLTAHGSGASGNPVTIQFESGASLLSPGEAAFINGGNFSHFVITGRTTCGWVNGAEVPCMESIYNTLNGYAGQTCPGGPCVDQVQTQVINNFNSDLEVRNLTIGPVYIHGGTSDTTFSAPGPKCVDFTTGGGTMNFHNLIMHDVGWCLNGGGNLITVANVEIYHFDHGMGMGQYTDSPNTWTGITVHDSYLHDPGVWDQANNAFHHDGIHLFSYCATSADFCPSTKITGVNIYNNRFGGDWGNNNTANIFFEPGISNANIFNNVTVVYPGRQLNNGQWNGYGTNVNFFNNTVLGPGAAYQTEKYSIFTGFGITIENNVWTDGGMISTNGPWPGVNCPYTIPPAEGGGTQPCVNLNYTLKTNAYLSAVGFANGLGYTNCTGSSCAGNGFLNFTSTDFAVFEASAHETGGVFGDTVEPNGTYFNASTGATTYGSPTIAAGTNLTSLCTSLGISGNPCLGDIAGTPRPSSGAWDIGAYQFSSGPNSPPSPPTSLGGSVQ